jgi:HEAT repeat protein
MEDALASLGNSVPGAIPPVIELLANGNVEVRRKAARVLALAGVKTPDGIAALFEAISHEGDHQVRARLAKALQLSSTPGPDPSAVLAAALDDEFVPVRQEAARRVRQTAPRGAKYGPLLLRMLKDPEPSIRRLGLETLRRCGLRSTELMRKVAKAQRDLDPGVRCRAAEALIEAGATDRVSIALLINDLKKDEDTARCAEDVLSLAGLFDADVVHSMTRLVQEEKDPDIRSRAARVLMHLGPRAREAVPALLHAQKDDVPGAAIALKAVHGRGARKK